MTNGHFSQLLEALSGMYGGGCDGMFRSPGRTELIGNHTDHQHGRVIAAAVSLSLYAAVSATNSGRLRVSSEGMPPVDVDLKNLDPIECERGTSAALVRGVAAGFAARGMSFDGRGLDMCVSGGVPIGSGLSSSACFEVLVATAVDEMLFGGALAPVERAKIARDAENAYFDKPCGLMDQLACACGGVTAMDLLEPEEPVITNMRLDLAREGFALCLVDSHSGHEDLTDEYSAVAAEMSSAAAFLGHSYLRGAGLDELAEALPKMREALGDRACMRALHFVSEDARAAKAAAELASGDFRAFLELVRQSGQSSSSYLQNVSPPGSARSQPLALTLALCSALLEGRGAVRVHGGGFGGWAQCYVPLDVLDRFICGCETALGKGSVRRLELCPYGAARI